MGYNSLKSSQGDRLWEEILLQKEINVAKCVVQIETVIQIIMNRANQTPGSLTLPLTVIYSKHPWQPQRDFRNIGHQHQHKE